MIELVLQGTDCMHLRHEVVQHNAVEGRLRCCTRGVMSSDLLPVHGIGVGDGDEGSALRLCIEGRVLTVLIGRFISHASARKLSQRQANASDRVHLIVAQTWLDH